MNEFELIAEYFAPLCKKEKGAFGLLDDAAVVAPRSGYQFAITTDAISEDIHFPANTDAYTGDAIKPRYIAQKLLRTNLSDIAAMGAKPKFYLLNVMLNHSTHEEWIADFVEGLAKDQEAFGITLIGGDTIVHQGPLTFSVTMLGEVKKTLALTRSGAEVGDNIYVSGTVGDGALGLRALRGEVKGLSREEREFLLDRYHFPNPRLELGQALAEGELVSAAMDISDGVLADLRHLCRASGCGAEVHQHMLPLSSGAVHAVTHVPEDWEHVWTGGDDYELLFTAASKNEAKILKAAQKLGVPVTKIGKITTSSSVKALDEEKNELSFNINGYTHI
jgi:thiamine-monophosphate kinase